MVTDIGLTGNPEFEVSMTGPATLDKDFNEVSMDDLRTGELMFGLLMAIVVLIFVFGALVTAAVPILLALVSIVIALGLAMLFGQVLNVSIFLMNMVFMMGLAVEIDYCLFIVARFREERARGVEKLEAIRRAGATASQAVLFSGITVVLALAGLLMVQHDIFISLGLGAILVVLVAIVASLTLLPAMLSLLGDRVNALRLPFVYRFQARSDEQAAGGMWDRIARGVMRAPIISILLSAGLLIAALVPIVDMNVGVAGVSTLPDKLESKRGYVALERDFAAGLAAPVVIAVDGAVDEPSVQEGIERLMADLDEDEAFGAIDQKISPERDLARLAAPVTLPGDWVSLVLGIGREMLLGATIGFATSLLFLGVQVGAQQIGQQMGIALANVFNPVSRATTNVLGGLFHLTALVIFLSIGGHRLMMHGLLETFDTVPLMGFGVGAGVLKMVVSLLTAAYVMTVKVAAPVLVAMMLASVAMGLIQRTMPQFNILSAGFQIRVMVAALILAVSVASLGPLVGRGWEFTMTKLAELFPAPTP